MIGSAPPVVANPADITSYYRAMKQREGGGGGGGCRVGGWPDAGVGGVARARKGVSCAKREACIRRLCSTVVYDYLLTAVVFLVPPFVPRPAYIYARRSRVLFIWPSLGCLRKSPRPPSASVASRKRQRRVFTSRCAHITPTADKLTSLSSCLLCLPCSSDFSRLLPSSTFLAISMKYFKDRLPVVHPPRASSAISGLNTRANV